MNLKVFNAHFSGWQGTLHCSFSGFLPRTPECRYRSEIHTRKQCGHPRSSGTYFHRFPLSCCQATLGPQGALVRLPGVSPAGTHLGATPPCGSAASVSAARRQYECPLLSDSTDLFLPPTPGSPRALCSLSEFLLPPGFSIAFPFIGTQGSHNY